MSDDRKFEQLNQHSSEVAEVVQLRTGRLDQFISSLDATIDTTFPDPIESAISVPDLAPTEPTEAPSNVIDITSRLPSTQSGLDVSTIQNAVANAFEDAA